MAIDDLVPQLDVALHLRAAQVDVAVLQAHFFIGQHGIGGREGQRLAVVQQAQLVGDHFDLAGGDVLVDGAGVAQLDVADDGEHKLRAHGIGLVVHLGAGFGGDDDLRDAAAVAQIEEDEVAEIAPPVDPAHENDVWSRRQRRAARHTYEYVCRSPKKSSMIVLCFTVVKECIPNETEFERGSRASTRDRIREAHWD